MSRTIFLTTCALLVARAVAQAPSISSPLQGSLGQGFQPYGIPLQQQPGGGASYPAALGQSPFAAFGASPQGANPFANGFLPQQFQSQANPYSQLFSPQSNNPGLSPQQGSSFPFLQSGFHPFQNQQQQPAYNRPVSAVNPNQNLMANPYFLQNGQPNYNSLNPLGMYQPQQNPQLRSPSLAQSPIQLAQVQPIQAQAAQPVQPQVVQAQPAQPVTQSPGSETLENAHAKRDTMLRR